MEADLGSELPLQRVGYPHRESFTHEEGGYDDITARSTFTWTAPRAGTYVISNAGSGPDSRLSVHLESCNGPMAPSTDAGHPRRYQLEAGQRVFLTLWGLVHGTYSRLGWVNSQYHLRIAEVAMEAGACEDRQDNDGDGRVDCADAACAGVPACSSGLACADRDLGSASPALGEGPPERSAYDFFAPGCGPQGRSESVFRWGAPADGRYVFHANGYGYTLAIWSGCTGTQLACASRNDYEGPDYVRPVLVRDVRAGETLLLVMQGAEMDDEIPLSIPDQLLIHPWVEREGEGLCEDRRDNDGDGRVDEDDPSCPNYREW